MPRVNALRDRVRYPQRLARTAVSSAVATEFENAIFIFEQVADGLNRDSPQLGKFCGGEVLLRHRAYVGFFQVTKAEFGWFPV